jgi:Xaa-Pro aminopeptidase
MKTQYSHDIRRARLLSILDDRGASELVLTSTGALGWYLGGARVQVSLVGDPVAAVVVRHDEDEVITFENEYERLVAEELPTGLAVSVVRWDAPLLGPRHARSARVLHEEDVTGELRAARASLLPDEVNRYSALGVDAAVLLTDVLSEVRPTDTEWAVTARIAHRIVEMRADALVLLAAGRSRLAHRHPLASDAVLGNRAMFVICARREGLIVNVTRWVRFGAPTAHETDAMARILQVEKVFLEASFPGARVADAFDAGISAYAANGFGSDEWTKHHQGGPCGYNGRDPRASASVPDLIMENQAFAWNPSGPGAKVEDTVLVGSGGTRVLSVDPRWPSTMVSGLARPSELEL